MVAFLTHLLIASTLCACEGERVNTFARECERACAGCVLCLCCQVCAHMFVRAHAHMEGGYRVKPPEEAEAQNFTGLGVHLAK